LRKEIQYFKNLNEKYLLNHDSKEIDVSSFCLRGNAPPFKPQREEVWRRVKTRERESSTQERSLDRTEDRRCTSLPDAALELARPGTRMYSANARCGLAKRPRLAVPPRQAGAAALAGKENLAKAPNPNAGVPPRAMAAMQPGGWRLELPRRLPLGPVGAPRATLPAALSHGPRPIQAVPAAGAAAPLASSAGAAAPLASSKKRCRQEARSSSESATRHAERNSYSWELGLLDAGGSGASVSHGPLSDPTSFPRACNTTLAAIPLVHGKKANEQAEEGDYTISKATRNAAALHGAVIKLLLVLPRQAVMKLAGVDPADDSVDAGRVLGYCLRVCQSRWAVGTINNARRAWTRFELWLREKGVDHDLGSVSDMVLNEYLLSRHTEASTSSEAEWAGKLSKWKKQNEVAVAAGQPTTAEPVRKRFGNKAALGQFDGLHFLTVNMFLKVPTTGKREELPEFASYAEKRLPATAPPLPLWVVGKLEEFVLRTDTPPAIRNAAAAVLFMVFSCGRAEQVQRLHVYGEHAGCIWGHFECEKGRNKRPRAFWAALEGFLGDGWWRALLETLKGVESGGFIFREFIGDVYSEHAIPQQAALSDDLITPRLRLVLRHACGMSKVEAEVYTKHSCRHCLPASSSARGEGFARQVEVGRWAGGSACSTDVFEDGFWKAKKALDKGQMPIRYTARLRPLRIAAIMAQQTASFRLLLQQLGGDIESLPRTCEGYRELPKFDPSCECA
jgi:hypothetical protein